MQYLIGIDTLKAAASLTTIISKLREQREEGGGAYELQAADVGQVMEDIAEATENGVVSDEAAARDALRRTDQETIGIDTEGPIVKDQFVQNATMDNADPTDPWTGDCLGKFNHWFDNELDALEQVQFRQIFDLPNVQGFIGQLPEGLYKQWVIFAITLREHYPPLTTGYIEGDHSEANIRIARARLGLPRIVDFSKEKPFGCDDVDFNNPASYINTGDKDDE
jgi:hypothetical protein